MQRPLLFFALLGLAIIVGVSAAGYYLGTVAENRATRVSPSPETTVVPRPSPSPSASLSPSPSVTRRPSPPARTPLPTAPPASARPTPKASVKGESFPSGDLPTIAPRRRPGGSDAAGDLRVVFVDVPSQVRSGEGFAVSWRVEGSEGAESGTTTLSWTYRSGGSASSGKQSFGTLTVPATFTTRLTFGGASGTIHLTAEAIVGENTVRETTTVKLENGDRG